MRTGVKGSRRKRPIQHTLSAVRDEQQMNIMSKLGKYEFNPIRLIDEVKSRPRLYLADQPLDLEEKLMLWKEIGANLYKDWDTFNEATVHHRVRQLRCKWRSLRDAYRRELRARRSGVRVTHRVYMYFKRMRFLGGFDGSVSEKEDVIADVNIASKTHSIHDDAFDDPLFEDTVPAKPKKQKHIKRKKKRKGASHLANDEVEMQVFSIPYTSSNEMDSDRLFLLSFLPEMRQLPLNVRMWARAQIANIMQEAVASHFPTHGHEKILISSTGNIRIQKTYSS